MGAKQAPFDFLFFQTLSAYQKSQSLKTAIEESLKNQALCHTKISQVTPEHKKMNLPVLFRSHVDNSK